MPWPLSHRREIARAVDEGTQTLKLLRARTCVACFPARQASSRCSEPCGGLLSVPVAHSDKAGDEVGNRGLGHGYEQ